MGLLEDLSKVVAAFVEGECDLWQDLAGERALLQNGLAEAVAQAESGERSAWDHMERCWQHLTDPRCAEEIEAFYRLEPDFERARIDARRLHHNARSLAATARVAMAAWYCTVDNDQPLLVACAHEAADLLGGRSGAGVDGLSVTHPDPAVTVERTFDLLARSGWLVAGARFWTLTWLDPPGEGHRHDRHLRIPVVGYHPQERGFLADLHLSVLDGEGELVEAPGRALHPLGPELITAVKETWARFGSPTSFCWCLAVRPTSLPPWLPLDGPSLAGPLAVGLRVLARGKHYDAATVLLGQPADGGHRLEPVGFERQKLEAVVDWNVHHSAGSEVLFRRAAVSKSTALTRQDIEEFKTTGLAISRVHDLDEAAKLVRPKSGWRTRGLIGALVLLIVAAGVAVVRPWSQGCPSERTATVTVAAMWSGEEQNRFQEVLEHFCRTTGIRVQYNNVSEGDMAGYLKLREQDPPDIAMIPQPGLIRELADAGKLKPLQGDAITRVEANYPLLAQDVMRVGKDLYGVWFKASNKSMWWYNPKVLRSRGIEPQSAWSWDDMLAAAQETRRRGVPWLAIGAADGWPLTDLFENIYLRTAGPECYDALSEHTIGWDHATVVRALTHMRALFVEGGLVPEAPQTKFRSSVAQVFGQQAAATVYGADFVLSVIQSENSAAKAEEDFDYFDFPSIDKSDPMVVAGGDIAVSFTDNGDTQELLAFLATPEAAAIWASRGGFVSPNQKVDPSKYSDRMTRRAAQSLTQHLTGTGSFRFDLSDLQRPAFGADPLQALQLGLRRLAHGEGEPRIIASELEQEAVMAYGVAVPQPSSGPARCSTT